MKMDFIHYYYARKETKLTGIERELKRYVEK